jgi:hypothetical protein
LTEPSEVRQLRKANCHAARFVFGQPLVHRAPVRLLVEIEIAQRLPVGCVDDEAVFKLVDCPGAAESGRLTRRSQSAKPVSQAVSIGNVLRKPLLHRIQ